MFEGHNCRRVRFGDVEAGFAQADRIVEAVYRTSPIEHAPTETTGAIAVPEANGRFTVYTNTQALYFTLDNTAIILQVPGNQLRFIGGTVGGGFGGKVDVIVEPLATLGAMKTGRPVRYVYSRTGGDAGLLDAQPVGDPHQGRRDGRRAARGAQGDELCRLRRVQPPDALRADQARRQRGGAVRHPERVDRRLLRVHQPHAHLCHARLRHHDGVVCDRGADGPHRRGVRRRPVDGALHERLPRRRHQAAPQGGRGRDADRDAAGRGRAGGPRADGRAAGNDVGAAGVAGGARAEAPR